MQIELRCPSCPCRFGSAPDTPADEILDRMIDDGPWFALGEGETFEDMISAALLQRGRICCPECREPVWVGEASLGWVDLGVWPRC
jgi:hypothetical protein